ncbi:MAG: DUF4982 domain-containing protein [Candidatus Marinimicrobia bacterium]|nr:DUF4982 domain-containing protein [Candidatus Neomarinimicrobiota bacterium]
MTDLGNSAVPWQNINLPHTWNAFDATDNNPGYRRDISWYKKEIFIPKLKSDQKLYLCFEGVNIVCDVFVNDKRAGGHVGGYVGFEVDITDFVKFGKTNSIRVKVDNSINREIIPSQKSDFFIYGGITRDVYLKVLNPVHIFGMKIFTPQVTEKEAQTYVTVSVQSNTGKTQSIIIKLLNNDGLVVGEKALDQKLNKGQNEVKIDLPTLKNPQLWSPDSPNLYSLEITLENSDQLLQKFGYRWFEFKDKGPFYLNGRRLLLRGTHRHEEWAGYGAAMPNELHRRDMEMIKDMGANFVRLAHYPQDPEIYKACDELGLLVWDELPWCRGGVGNDVWQENTQQLFEEQINQNFNHPSIILWSIGNEMYWLPDFEGGDDKEKLVTFAKELNDIAHKMDPQRKTTMRKFYDGADITDVFSPSIWAGWYSGVYKTYEKALLTSRAKYRHFLHAEYGGSSHVGRHSENPISGEGQVKEDEWAESPNMINVDRIASVGDWSENYIVDLFDWHLKTTEQLDWFIGNAQWAFKDFGTPLRPENPIPYMNQKGLVDRDGNPKDAYYVFKSYWTNNPAFCYIESHTWPERYGKPGEKKELCVFSNCQEVEMVVNGLSYGKKRRDINDFPAAGYHWNVEFDDGKNEILAIGYNGEKQACFDKIEITYTARKIGTPEEILLTAKKLDNGNYLITARVVDKQGTTCLDFNERVYFDCNGGGYLKENLGTPTGSRILEFASGRAHIEYVPEPGLSGIIEARTQDFKGSYLEIKN